MKQATDQSVRNALASAFPNKTVSQNTTTDGKPAKGFNVQPYGKIIPNADGQFQAKRFNCADRNHRFATIEAAIDYIKGNETIGNAKVMLWLRPSHGTAQGNGGKLGTYTLTQGGRGKKPRHIICGTYEECKEQSRLIMARYGILSDSNTTEG